MIQGIRRLEVAHRIWHLITCTKPAFCGFGSLDWIWRILSEQVDFRVESTRYNKANGLFCIIVSCDNRNMVKYSMFSCTVFFPK